MHYGFIIDNRKCIGCHACTTACKSEHEVPVGVFRTWVKQVEKGEFPNTRRLFSVMRCNHCTDAPCVEICPVEALYIRPDGIVDFDKNRCIGCKSCMQACPYDALYIDPDTRTAAKCNYCAHRVDIGLEPACVNVCPEHAIISGDMDNPNSEIAQLLARETVTVRKPEKGTKPNLFYIDGDYASLNPAATEKPEYTLWGAQARGVGHYAKQTEKLAFDGDNLVSATLAASGASATVGELKQNGIQKSVGVLTGGFVGVVQKQIPFGNDKISDPKRVYDAPDKGILWGWEVSAYVWTKAIAAGVFLVPVLFGFTSFDSFTIYPPAAKLYESFILRIEGAVWALFFLFLTTLFLVKDLDQPKRFLYVLLRPQWKSWLVRGGYSITAYGGFLTLLCIASVMGWETVAIVSLWLAAFAAVMTAIYTAFLFAQAKGRDFWQSPALAVHMLLHSFIAGAAFFAVLGLFAGFQPGWSEFLKIILVPGIVLNLLTMLVELTITHPTQDAKLVVKMIVKGRYSSLFWWGVVMLGNIVPLVALMSGQVSALPVAGLFALIGIFLTEKIWVEAPQRIQLS